MAGIPLKRRDLLRGAIAAPLASASLAACSTTDSSTTRRTEGKVEAPTRIPFTGVKADLPAGNPGIPAGYFHYPSDPPSFYRARPDKAGPVTILTQSDIVMAAKDKNRWWQALNSAVNADLQVTSTSSVDYKPKFQVTVAGGELPDVLLFTTVQNTPALLESQFADLSDYLGGDNIADYPGLASLPTATWEVSTIGGRIWGIPKPISPAGTIITARGDLLAQLGVDDKSPILSSGDDFLALCKQLTDPKRHKWALGALPTTWILNAVLEMMGAPNGWKEENGRFTNVAESEEMKEALNQVATMWSAGYIHPDSFGTPGQNYTWWSGGTTALYIQSFSGWARYAKVNPSWNLGVVRHPKWDGGGFANKALGPAGYGAFAALKKSSPQRIRRILQIIDYLASPFGTKEYLLTNYGVGGVDYTLNGTDPIATPTGNADYPQGILYCGGQGNVDLYTPGANNILTEAHGYLSAVLPTGVRNSSSGLYSETNVTVGATANKNLADAQSDIIQGRKKISEWDTVVRTWRQQAGDGIRADYEKAFADRD